jgi:5-enolpyruvylshikimate-3-phosphate synthase
MIEIFSVNKTIYGSLDLESSKSISNRLLIIKELCKTKFEIQNLSNARDTKILFEILSNYKTRNDLNCEDAWNSVKIYNSISCNERR